MINLQPASLDIWDKKYRLKTKEGVPIDTDVAATLERVARALSDIESPEQKEHWYQRFLWALNNGAIPAGRVISNSGANTSTINCVVSNTIPDSMVGILNALQEAGLTLKAGCGIGYEFSTLRPKGAYVAGAGASTSGPLSFMDVFDSLCRTISSAGGRRGAQMATFDISHPDIEEFIRAKGTNGRLRQFNLSCLITEKFIKAVEEDAPWDLTWQGQVYRTLPARELWDLIMSSTYEYAEPGFILIDRVNELNNNWFCESIRSTNPCGEQPLPPYGACLLGSVNLTQFVRKPFTPYAHFDWATYVDVVRVFTRMLDNVVEIHGLPLSQQANEIQRKRRHGMGFLGLGSAMTMLGLKYGDAKSIVFTESVTQEMAVTGWEVGVELAREKGPAPIMNELFDATPAVQARVPGVAPAGGKVTGRVLLAHGSHYMARLPSELRGEIAKYGCRFTHHTSIAPTGTIALSLANNASNGIEPSFSHQYSRNIIREGRKTKEKVDVLSYELLAYRAYTGDPMATLPEYSVSPKAHVDIQAAAQKWVDSSISKTINIPTDYPYEEFKEIYLYAYHQGLKGCTTFRFNPTAFQGVLVKDEDLAATTYRFTMEDGTTLDLRGDEEVEYDGATHTAANLYDALKEGYYGSNTHGSNKAENHRV